MNTPKHRCLIVDDEPIARQILLGYVAMMPNLECVAACKNALEALEHIHQDPGIDLLFLDINMPNLDGMALVRALPRRLQVVFTTAYSEYAVESYDLNAADYLLKPFLFERFAQAVLKAVERIKTPALLQPPAPESAVMLIKSGGELHRLQLTDIVFCEAMRNYTKIVLRNGVILCPLIPISRLEDALETLAPAGTFLRVHRSFLIPLAQAGPLGSGYVMVGGMYKIPVGQQFKAAVLQRLGV